MADIFDRINGTVVTPELLLEVLEMHIALSPEDREVFENSRWPDIRAAGR